MNNYISTAAARFDQSISHKAAQVTSYLAQWNQEASEAAYHMNQHFSTAKAELDKQLTTAESVWNSHIAQKMQDVDRTHDDSKRKEGDLNNRAVLENVHSEIWNVLGTRR